MSAGFLYLGYRCIRSLYKNRFKKGVFRNNGSFVEDWDGNGGFLFFAIAVDPKRSSSHLTPDRVCRLDNQFFIEIEKRRYAIDTKKINDINLARRYAGILPGSFSELIDLFKVGIRNRRIDCNTLKQWYDQKKDRMKRPFIIFGFRGYKVHYWQLSDGDTGYARLGKNNQVLAIMDRSAYISNHVIFRLAGAAIFFIFAFITFMGFYSKISQFF